MQTGGSNQYIFISLPKKSVGLTRCKWSYDPNVVSFLSSCMQVQVLSVVPLDHVKTSSYSGNSATTPSMAGSGLSCVNLAKTQLDTLEEEQYGSRASQGNSPVIESFNSTDIVPLRRRYSTKLDGTRQPPGEILSRVLRETPSHEIPSPLQHKCKVREMLLAKSFAIQYLKLKSVRLFVPPGFKNMIVTVFKSSSNKSIFYVETNNGWQLLKILVFIRSQICNQKS